jgi:hypothetical protein
MAAFEKFGCARRRDAAHKVGAISDDCHAGGPRKRKTTNAISNKQKANGRVICIKPPVEKRPADILRIWEQ